MSAANIKNILSYIAMPLLLGAVIGLSYIAFFAPRSAEVSANLPQTQTEAVPQRASYASAVARAAPSVVNIYTSRVINRGRNQYFDDPVFRQFFNIADIPQQQRMQSALGSGVIVSSDGYLLTNFHVINGAIEIVVALQDGRDAKAELIGTNIENDLAVLKIDLPELSPIEIGDSEKLLIGDVVLAIGNPFGMGQTVTQGIVSATQRRGLNISLYENFIQTDAAINPGNSGGALVDVNGKLLGINVANLGQTAGFGFAIPANVAMQTLVDIKSFGQVIRGWLGVTAAALSIKRAQSLNLDTTNGILITEVQAGGPADKAGLKANDVIVAVNDQRVDDLRTGIQEIAESRPGETAKLDIMRDGEMLVINAVLGLRPN